MNRNQFRSDLEALLNRHSMENGSNTPDFLLGNYMMACLAAFESATNAREEWYGTHLYPGKGAGVPSQS